MARIGETQMKLKIDVGIKNLGYQTFESDTYPQFDGGMMFIMCLDGTQVALPYREIDGVYTRPVTEQQES